MIDFPSYITGFVDGEGCFTLYRNTAGHSFTTDFTIRVRADDTEIVERIRNHFGDIGSFSILENSSQFDNANPVAQWKVVNPKEQALIIKHFDKYPLLAKKRNDYVLWRQAVIERQKPKRMRDNVFLRTIHDKMHLLKRFDDEQLLFDLEIARQSDQLVLF